MDFFEKIEYTEKDLRELISSQAEESIHLDFKAAGALDKTNEKRAEIAKDVSAFANSDGGIIVYGMTEENHVAGNFSFIDGNEYTKEWLERVINDGIQRRVLGIQISPIRVNGDIKQTVYVVKIPRSANAPHMCVKRHIYYRRYNFESVPMEDYEIRDLYNRTSIPKLGIIGCFLSKMPQKLGNQKSTKFSFVVMIDNYGRVLCHDYKLISYFFCVDDNLSPKYTPALPLITKAKTLEIGDMYCTKISTPSIESIFPKEKIEFGHVEIEVPVDDVESFMSKAFVVSTLYWEGGGQDSILYFCNGDESIYERDKIEKYIPEHLQQYILGYTENESKTL